MTTESDHLRAILQSPAVEALRADFERWLASQHDPRADFLRKEARWAATRKGRDAARVLEAAATLDPVWVARVSRPPLGAFLTRTRLHHSGPPLCAEDLDWFERRFQCQMPADYRGFLLNYNGGWPKPERFRLAHATPSVENASVAYLCHVRAAREPESDLDLDLVWRAKFLEQLRSDGFGFPDEMARWRSSPYQDWMIIGATPPTAELEWLCLGCRGETFGQVHLVTTYLDSAVTEDHLFVAPTFAAFLGLMETGE
jgi:hypothetical protein